MAGLELLLFHLMLAGIGTAKFLPIFLRHRRQLRSWQDAADVCGLQVLETSFLAPSLKAQAGPFTVTFMTTEDDDTRIFVQGPVPPSLFKMRIRRESLLRRSPEVEIGDPSFDSKFFIEGPVRDVLSLLDAELRGRMIRASTESRLEISTGMLQADLSDDMVIFLLPLLLDIGRQLARPVDVLQRLTGNARRDPEPGVRLSNLLLLARELPGKPGTVEALRTACSDPSPEVRLRAAQVLGTEGRGVLLDLAESLVDDTVSAEAVSILDRELSIERTQALLAHALDRSLPKTARACLEALGRSGDAAAAEPFLIRALQREEADLRMATVHALGRVGTAAAVLPLQEAAEGSWLDRELNRAARQAIAEIQSRLQGAAPGQLSMAVSQGGELSPVSPEAGQVSLAVEPFPLSPEEPEQPSPRAREGPAGRPV